MHQNLISYPTCTKTQNAGAGYGQVYAVSLLSTYYASLMALIVSYLIDSFRNPLPWTDCRPEWPNCVPAGSRSGSDVPLPGDVHHLNRYLVDDGNVTYFAETTSRTGSSEYYFMWVCFLGLARVRGFWGSNKINRTLISKYDAPIIIIVFFHTERKCCMKRTRFTMALVCPTGSWHSTYSDRGWLYCWSWSRESEALARPLTSWHSSRMLWCWSCWSALLHCLELVQEFCSS